MYNQQGRDKKLLTSSYIIAFPCMALVSY